MGILDRKLIKKKSWVEVNEKLKAFTNDISNATSFVREIEKGNLDVTIEDTNSSVELGNSLVAMRDQMKKFSLQDQERRWVNEGLARFVEILRAKNENLETLSHNIISSLVNYMKANQGGLFLVNDDNSADVHLELQACYAYSRKKYLQKRIELGEGLTGQAVLEKNTIYMTNVPKDFVKITSGLGEAPPRNVLVVPLKMEERVFGVIEIAAFQILKKHEIEFVEKLGESIASTIASVKVGDRTTKLLQATQQQAEEMKSQEEEMRQNMEELTATQEEMRRILQEVEGKEAYTNALLNVTSDSIFTIDKEYKLITWNRAMAQSLERFSMRLEKGMSTLDWYPGEERTKQIALFKRIFAGENLEFTAASEINGSTYHFLSVYAPLRNDVGEIAEVAVFAKDVTAMVNAQQRAEQMRKDAQNQAEELKAQEEELRQNMEELSSTQEEMHRILKEVEGKEAYTNALLNVTSDSIFTIDKNYKLITWNKAMAQTLERFGMRLEKGMDTLDWYPGEERAKQIELYAKVFAGQSVEFTAPSVQEGKTYHFLSVYAPLRNEKGEVYEVAVFAKDVTAITNAKIEVEAHEQYLNGVLNVSGDSILTLDRQFKVLTFNKVFSSTFEGRGISVGKGFDILTIFDKAEVNKKIELYERIFKGETYETVDHLHNEVFDNYFLVKHAPIADNAGQINSIAIFAKDVTEVTKSRQKAEALLHQTQQQGEELKAQEEELRQNMEELHAQQEDMGRQLTEIRSLKENLEVREMVFGETTILSEADPHGTITFVNSKFCEVSGYTKEELIGQPHSMLRHPDMPKELFKKMWTAIKKGEVFKGIIKNKAKDGSHYWVDASIVPVKDNNGKIIKYVGARYHITNEEVATLLYKAQLEKLKTAAA